MLRDSRTKLTIANDLTQATRLVSEVVQIARKLGYGAASQFAIQLAMDEAMMNAIEHGNHAQPDRHVQVEYQISPDRIVVSICDEGTGFDVQGVPDPTDDEHIERTHGRGVMLMRAYMTEVRYNEQGNCVTLIKERTCTRPGQIKALYR